MLIKNCLTLILLFLLSAALPVALIGSDVIGSEGEQRDPISFERFQAAQEALLNGKTLYAQESKENNLTQAEASLLKAVETFPQMADAHYYLSLLYFKQADLKKAQFHIMKALASFQEMQNLYAEIIKKNPQLIAPPYNDYGKKNLGLYFAMQGDIFWKHQNFNSARAQYLMAINQNPDLKNLYHKLVRLYFNEESYMKAYNYLIKAEAVGIKFKRRFRQNVILAASNPKSFQKRNSGRGFFLGLHYGRGTMAGGNFGDMVDNATAYYTMKIEQFNWENISMKEDAAFTEWSATLGYGFKKWGFALETGRISKKFHVDNAVYDYHIHQEGTWDQTFSAVPVLFNVYYKLFRYAPGDAMFQKNISIDARLLVGAGWYKGRYSGNYDQNETPLPSFIHDFSDVSKQTSLGFHTGVSLNVNVSTRWSLILETRYRFVSFNQMKGKGAYSTDQYIRLGYEGDLNYVTDKNNGPSFFDLGGGLLNRYIAQSARLNLDGFTMNVGIRYNF